MIPIFIISFNRLESLKQSINSYLQIKDHQIVIHDTGSTYEPLLAYLGGLERDGTTVYWNKPSISSDKDLNSVNETVQNFLSKNPSIDFYVVTDPDIALEPGCDDIFDFYKFAIKTYELPVIGPMLRIDDIPDHYPLKEKVIRGHTAQFWSKQPINMTWNARTLRYQPAPIDTTFAMYPRNLSFRRLRSGWRTYEPYWAKHLDWYIDPDNMTDDQKYYLQTASSVSHWGGPWLRDKIISGVDPDYYSE